MKRLATLALLVPLALTLLGAQPVVAAAAAPVSASFDGWWLNGVAVAGTDLRLAKGQAQLTCSTDDIDGLQPTYDTNSGLCRASDTLSEYTGGDFVYGTTISPVFQLSQPVKDLIASWDAMTPSGTWLELHVRVQQDAGWTGWYSLPVWTGDPSTLQRHSGNGQQDASAKVDTDSLVMAPGQPAHAYQLEATLFSQSPDVSAAVHLIRATSSADSPPAATDHTAWGTELPVPQRSQMLPQYQALGYGGGGEAWCSPTSTSMIMAYWGNMLHLPQLVLPVPTVAMAAYDYVYKGTGNWAFNTAFAGSNGLVAYVERFSSFDQLEPWVKDSVPIAISIAFKPGQLPGAPIPSTPGHLIVVRGFTASGDVIVNDPAASSDPAVRMVYPRAALETVWQGHAGMAYVIYPPGWTVPTN